MGEALKGFSFFMEVNQMTNDQKKIVQKMREEGHSYLQIASTLGISENTIKSYCRRSILNSIKSIKNNEVKETHTSCKYCGKPLNNGIKGQPKKFCSEGCRHLWWRDNDSKLNKKAYYTITCAECGKEFESYGNKNRKFCGHACYINNRFKKGEDLNYKGAI
jgi:endogenous inhibitor of DNA gyrase (YacG/DUF329 family)